MSATSINGTKVRGARTEASDRRRASVESAGSVSSMEYGFGETDLGGSGPSGISQMVPVHDDADENEGYIDVEGIDDSPTAEAATDVYASASLSGLPQNKIAASTSTTPDPAISTETTTERVSSAVATSTVAASTPPRRGTIDRQDDAALAFMKARAASASTGAASAVVHSGHEFAKFSGSTKANTMYGHDICSCKNYFLKLFFVLVREAISSCMLGCWCNPIFLIRFYLSALHTLALTICVTVFSLYFCTLIPLVTNNRMFNEDTVHFALKH